MKNKILEILNNNVTESKNDYNKIYEKDFDNLANEIIAVISVTHCCTELKSKEAMTFSQWIERFDFKPLGNKQYLRGITTIGFDVVREKYLNYIKNL